MKESNSKRWLMAILIAIIVVLAGLVIYLLAVKPALTGNTIKLQNEGVQIAVNYIVSQVSQNGYVQIPVGNETLILVPYQSSQQPSE